MREFQICGCRRKAQQLWSAADTTHDRKLLIHACLKFLLSHLPSLAWGEGRWPSKDCRHACVPSPSCCAPNGSAKHLRTAPLVSQKQTTQTLQGDLHVVVEEQEGDSSRHSSPSGAGGVLQSMKSRLTPQLFRQSTKDSHLSSKFLNSWKDGSIMHVALEVSGRCVNHVATCQLPPLVW